MKRIMSLGIALLALVYGLGGVVARNAGAAEVKSFDETPVEYDLGEELVKSYEKDEEGEAKLVEGAGFAEYGYSEDEATAGKYYGVYFYIYNPRGAELSEKAGMHAVNLATEYNASGEPSGYANVALAVLDHTADHVLYKMKVAESESLYARARSYAAAHEGERRYDIAGLQLTESGATTATDYAIGKTFKCTGFSDGMSDGGKALEIRGEILETIKLDVSQTYYRTKTSSLGKGHQSQLNTVWFSVPKKYFDEWDKLQRIKAEWWEYKTQPILVTCNEKFYNDVKDYIAVDVGDSLKGDYIEELLWGFGIKHDGMEGVRDELYDLFWNAHRRNIGAGSAGMFKPSQECEALRKLYWSFLVEGNSLEGSTVTREALEKYIYGYNKSFEHGELECKDRKVSADLFEADIDESRKQDNERGKIQKGYSFYDFDADEDLQKIETWNDTKPSWWETAGEYGFWTTLLGKVPEETGRTVSPIYIVQDRDIAGSDEEIAERLMISEKDVGALVQECQEAKMIRNEWDEEMEVVLFRFAVSDYQTDEVVIFDYTGFGNVGVCVNNQAYLAQESVFLNFDIISLTFKKANGQMKTYGVIMSPIDIVTPIEPPPDVILRPSYERIPIWAWFVFAATGIFGLGMIIKIVRAKE